MAGVMSGTSADGIDVAIVEITPRPDGSGENELSFLHHTSVPYPAVLREVVLAAMDAQSIAVAELARLNWRLGIAYAEAVMSALAQTTARVELVGCHGQTIYHQGKAAPYAERDFACTWQLGEMSIIAARSGLPVVSNFRPADMAAGGQGAPLVPYLDYTLFRSAQRNRVLQNLGGIANLTAIPAGAGAGELLAFDTGPANMVIDWLMQKLFDRPFDEAGSIAGRGKVLHNIVENCLRHAYFEAAIPKSAGREQFGARYAEEFLQICQTAGLGNEDIIATATALTVESIKMAFLRFVKPILANSVTDYILAGGGSQNVTMMTMLTEALAPLRCHVSVMDSFGLPSQAKEAAAFALLAFETWHHRPSNVPAATGAARPAILGEVIYSA